MSFVRVSQRSGASVPLTGVSLALRQPKKGKPFVQLFLGADILKQLRLKIGDRVVVEAGCDEHDGQLRLGKDPLGRTITRYSKTDTGSISVRAWRAFAVKEAPAASIESRISKGVDEPDKLLASLPAHWLKPMLVGGGAAATVTPPKARDVTSAVLGANGNGGRR